MYVLDRRQQGGYVAIGNIIDGSAGGDRRRGREQQAEQHEDEQDTPRDMGAVPLAAGHGGLLLNYTVPNVATGAPAAPRQLLT